MAVCHSAMVEGGEMHKLEYAAQSPDELALIKGARSVGVIYCKRTAKVITIEKKKRRHDFEILDEIPFDSDRKRMSLLVRCENRYLLMTKGADSIIIPRICFPNE